MKMHNLSKLAASISLSFLVFETPVLADGFEAASTPDMARWQCEFCPKIPEWTFDITAQLGVLSDDVYRYGNYTGIKQNQPLFVSGTARHVTQDGDFWITTFKDIGTDAPKISSEYGKREVYKLSVDFQTIPLRKYGNVSSPFVNPESNTLRLPEQWNKSNNSADFKDNGLFTPFNLGSDWDQFALAFKYTEDKYFDYAFSYQRIEENGIKESSANQYFQAVYFPQSTNTVTENIVASADFTGEQWFGNLAVSFSKFNNNLESTSFANPFSSFDRNANVTTVSNEPDNTAMKISLNTRYSYMPRSFAKVYMSYEVLKQNDDFLPYTTNQSLISPLERNSLNGEIDNQFVALKLYHWIDKNWSVDAKYDYRDRYNKTDLTVFRPVISDLFPAEAIINIPYDFTKESGKLLVNWNDRKGQLVTLGYKTDSMKRSFNTVRKTSDDTYLVNYKNSFIETAIVRLSASRANRSATALELIDLLSVQENPLMQRFNTADRTENKVSMQLDYMPTSYLDTVLTADFLEDKYDQTEIGLQYSWRNNLTFDVNWHVQENTNLGVYVQKQQIDTTMAGSSRFSTRDWFVDNSDNILSYGFNLTMNKLFESKLDLTASFQLSDADTTIDINNAGELSTLPDTSSKWITTDVKVSYIQSKQTTLTLSYVYQNFDSQDFSIDEVVPGAAANLLTFGAMSNYYNTSYVVFSYNYKF
jgi:MtrB/PioB family decaheme-associated outer membrane protein